MGFNPPSAVQFQIPNTLHNWPWVRQVNPHYEECKAESSAWLESFNAFSPAAQRAFNRCDFSLLAAMGYPRHNKAGLRIACDLMQVFFVIDEYTDVADRETAFQQAEITMHALRNPHLPRPEGEWVGGEIIRQFWASTVKIGSIASQRHFIDSFQTYMDSVIQQAEDRSHKHIRSIKGYLDVRRETIGAKSSFAILELYMDLPDYVLNDPTILKIANACNDLIIIDNDLYSYNVEQARGDEAHNLVAVVMHELNTDLNSALDWISKFHDETKAQFLEAYSSVPSWESPLDEQVAQYVFGLGHWVRANESWSFESERYFGKRGLEIQKTRLVDLLPKVKQLSQL